jgi:phosphoribosylaminoimidazole-succinocarboxamide synthase
VNANDLTANIKPDAQGKVRDIYDLGDKLLLVASDRISAFDYILPDEIPHKGQVLTQISKFWFGLLDGVVENHLISTEVEDLPEKFQPYAEYLRGRFMLVRKMEMFPVECIMRGYLAGSGLKEYNAQGTVCGIELPEGLVNSSKLAEPLFTPSTKAEIGDHDENISFERCAEILGEADAAELKRLSVAVYTTAADYAAKRGIIIADTKFEFGRGANGQIVLGDEVLTPDSSRFWPADEYEEGRDQASFDKQYVRDWLSANWDKKGNPPHLPADVIERTSEKYIQAYESITGEKFPF